MMLGDILAMTRASSARGQDWLRAADPELAARIEGAAAAEATDAGGYLRLAVAEFTERASADDWAALMTRLRQAPDPGRACLLTMIHWRLAKSGAPPPSAERTRR
jgi:hypothetical protein